MHFVSSCLIFWNDYPSASSTSDLGAKSPEIRGVTFGYLAKRGQGETLRKAGRINIQYQRVPCYYKASLKFKIDTGSNRHYLAFVVENVNGDGDLGFVEISPSSSKGSWLAMQRSFGATWKLDIPRGTEGPYSLRLTSLQSKKTVVANNVIPANWAPGQSYVSNVNL
ncbi:hypothetical protein CDL12_22717 [Handroanthus impetiginosus]|uniref:Expansin-like CBD domain-containing protein n=1 Tax=Handroanthus impetiginosus TaxID=429701 RepID=A0A2G9GHI4_9LAMI|nr:hypothetical protein CDL12_22717 [Handroanthus impetiginosus]